MCLRAHVGEWHGADMTSCAKGLPWPVLDRVRLLGLPGSIDESSVTFEIMTPGKIHPLRTIPVKPSKVLPMPFFGLPEPTVFSATIDLRCAQCSVRIKHP